MIANREQREGIYKKLGYEPTPEQAAMHFADLVDGELKEKWVSGGERGGKSYCSAKEIIGRCLSEGPLWWIAGQDYGNCRVEFEYCMHDAKLMSAIWKDDDISFPKEGQCVLKLYGGEKVIKTVSLKDIHHIGQEAPNGIIICEAAQVDWDAIMRCRTRVASSRGWLLLSGTLEGSLGWYAEKVKEYQIPNPELARTFYMPSWSNRALYSGREDPQIKHYENILPEDLFNERFGGIPCPVSNMIIREFRPDIHVGDYGFKSDLPVELAIDPGGAFKSGAYAVLALQEWAGAVYAVDEVYLQGYVTQDIIEVARKRLWWGNVERGVIDIAAKQHHTAAATDMPSDWDIWAKMTGLRLATAKIEEAGGIDRLRTFLKPDPVTKLPFLFVNRGCKGFISEAGGGRAPEGIANGGPWLRDKHTGKPIDRNNHSSKALYYWLVNKFGYITRDLSRLKKPVSYLMRV